MTSSVLDQGLAPHGLDGGLVDRLCSHLATCDADDVGSLGRIAANVAQQVAPLLGVTDRQLLVAEAIARTVGLGALDALLRDPDVTEVMVNAGRDVWVEKRGAITSAGTLAPGAIDVIVERVVRPLGRRIDRTNPVVDARLADGSRVCAVIAPIAVDGTTLCIRRFAVQARDLASFAPQPVVDLLTSVVAARCNLLVSGATSSGKTTLLNALASRIPPHERVVTLEDIAELCLATDHVVRLEARSATSEGVGAAGLDALLRTALRLRPDRLIVGEVRGPEALDMVQAMNTGHDGSWSSVHANGPADALRRVEAMVWQAAPGWPPAAIREHVRHAIDVVVHVVRAADGTRRVDSVVEVTVGSTDGSVRTLADAGNVVAPLTRRRRP